MKRLQVQLTQLKPSTLIYKYTSLRYQKGAIFRTSLHSFHFFFNPHPTVFAQLLYIIPRLLPATRGAAGCSAGAQEEKEENPSDLWTGATDSSSSWRKTALQLWRHPAFCQRGDTPQYQVAVSVHQREATSITGFSS